MKKVLMILWKDLFKPFLDPRPFKEAKTLINNWYKLEFLCLVHKNNFKNINIEKKEINGIKVNYIYYNAWKLITIGVIKSFISRYNMFLKWINIINKYKPDIIHCHDAFTLKFWAYYKKRNFKIKLIYDSHEICTEMWQSKFESYYTKIFEKPYLKYIDILISANDSRIPIFKKIYPILENKKIYSLYNYPELKDFDFERIKKEYRNKINAKINDIVFLYQWWLSSWRWILNIIKAFENLKFDNWKFIINWWNNIQINNLKNYIKRNKENFVFTWYIDSTEVENYMLASDIWFVSLLNISLNNYWAAPNKLYEYMMTKNYIIWPNFEVLKDFILDNKIWNVVDFSSVNDIWKILDSIFKIWTNIIEESKNNGFRLYKDKYNWNVSEKKLLEIYKKGF